MIVLRMQTQNGCTVFLMNVRAVFPLLRKEGPGSIGLASDLVRGRARGGSGLAG